MKRACRIFDEWQSYVRACDRKNKIIKQYKREKFRAAMRISTNLTKQFFKISKWIKNTKKRIISQTIISSLKKRSEITIKTHEKAKIMFETSFFLINYFYERHWRIFLFIINERWRDDDKSKTDKNCLQD